MCFRVSAQRVQARLEHMEYSIDPVPEWFNYSDSQSGRMGKAKDKLKKVIDFDTD